MDGEPLVITVVDEPGNTTDVLEVSELLLLVSDESLGAAILLRVLEASPVVVEEPLAIIPLLCEVELPPTIVDGPDDDVAETLEPDGRSIAVVVEMTTALAEEVVPSLAASVVDKALGEMVAEPLESGEMPSNTLEEVPSLTVADLVDMAELLDDIALSTKDVEGVTNVADGPDGDEPSPSIVELTADVARLLESDALAPFKVEEATKAVVMTVADNPSSPVFNELLDVVELLGPSKPVVVGIFGRTVVLEGTEPS